MNSFDNRSKTLKKTEKTMNSVDNQPKTSKKNKKNKKNIILETMAQNLPLHQTLTVTSAIPQHRKKTEKTMNSFDN